ncbi:hypothetical protein HCEG_01772 [Histoplasma capsulatum var. duboisii H88]|uniref:Uncharacterized protein n=2 Tax=Ajellomyces capsulatus TaxID=5037 RepID=F0U7E3_AJEC8|nr:hypothetical protein HCDG_02179 [Histoplasma capsulatum H143]EGC42410.1 hypothetical protein HCEG_01772 [Histoplasma capsulatum var. duboisii H88]
MPSTHSNTPTGWLVRVAVLLQDASPKAEELRAFIYFRIPLVRPACNPRRNYYPPSMAGVVDIASRRRTASERQPQLVVERTHPGWRGNTSQQRYLNSHQSLSGPEACLPVSGHFASAFLNSSSLLQSLLAVQITMLLSPFLFPLPL